ncbi:hypothetical protein AXG93_1130s1440 [Marchantia polymorpha subsp. ruderalis]|uniref:Uncharacterized protein n=1 Tax=Marchantia polymorpha subsp. ruderalis TaxID=1480154 RepID=A0A176VHT7_MARPO|nr:hypothetical protein AXG93_1130s1440 [Marchantia polymorpha subsp. ruderalis]
MAAARGRRVHEAGPTESATIEKKKSEGKKPRIIEGRPTLEGIRMKVPRERLAEVLTMSSDTKEKPVALEEVAAKAVEDVAIVKNGPQKVDESLKVDELLAPVKQKEQEYQIELAVRAEKLTDYEAARISDLELIEKLEAQCSKLRTQQSQAEEQLCELEAKLTETEEKNRQLSEGTRDALTARVKRAKRTEASSDNQEAQIVSYKIEKRWRI